MATKRLWRVTVISPYSIRAAGRNRKKGSPASAGFKVTSWYETKAKAQAAISALAKRAEAGRKQATARGKNAFHLDEEPDIEVKSVPYEAGLRGKIRLKNERI